MNAADHNIMAFLLLMLLGTSIITGAAIIFLASNWLRRRRGVNLVPASFMESCPSQNGAFLERPTRWVAIRSTNLLKVQTAFGLHNPTPCSSVDGLSKLNEGKLFVSPPVNGWILIIGSSLPDPNDDIDDCFRFLMRLSRELGGVQFFSVNRAVNHHAWVRIENERVFRAYAWAGETLWNQGDLTAAEREVGLRCYRYGEKSATFPFSPREAHAANTERIMHLAARWSVDPIALLGLGRHLNTGIAGEPSLGKSL
jgi:hypothetical protein